MKDIKLERADYQTIINFLEECRFETDEELEQLFGISAVFDGFLADRVHEINGINADILKKRLLANRMVKDSVANENIDAATLDEFANMNGIVPEREADDEIAELDFEVDEGEDLGYIVKGFGYKVNKDRQVDADSLLNEFPLSLLLNENSRALSDIRITQESKSLESVQEIINMMTASLNESKNAFTHIVCEHLKEFCQTKNKALPIATE